jgi:pimeloyl-ACP methyl ester carboxylesterase
MVSNIHGRAVRSASTERSTISGWVPSSDRCLNVPRAGRRREGFLGLWVRVPLAVVSLTALAVLTTSSARAQTAPLGLKNDSGLNSDVVFTEYFPLSSVEELVRRLFSPLGALRLNQEAQRAGRALRGQPIDLTKEHYSIYIPEHPRSPSGTYALLVFIPPWPRAEVPRQWIPILNRYSTILVTAANSGNDAPALDRREPLALLAAHNMLTQYAIDPQQVYIGGFSGGSRVAMRLALGYPDLFHGALLDAGSDAIGTADVPLPPADLFRGFQESTRLVYLTGEHDDENLALEMNSRRSMNKWCVFDVVTQAVPRTGHELADASSFSRALGSLLGPRQSYGDKLAKCRSRIDTELSAQLGQVESAFARGDSGAAKQLLSKIDERYGGLAAPRSADLATQPR